jgi:hypothetical protein
MPKSRKRKGAKSKIVQVVKDTVRMPGGYKTKDNPDGTVPTWNGRYKHIVHQRKAV